MISAYLLKPGAQRLESCGAPRLAGDWPPALSLELPVMAVQRRLAWDGGLDVRALPQPSITLPRREVWMPPRLALVVDRRVFVYAEMHEELEELLALAAVCVRCLERVLTCRTW